MKNTTAFPASFDADDTNTATGPKGQQGHRDLIAHSGHFQPKLWAPAPGVWSLVGNGISNQNFVEGPEGLIAIDTGESIEEMAWALNAVREVSDSPVVAVIYTHFHYTGGTGAVFADAGGRVPIWGHADIVGNRQRMRSEVGTAASRGLVHQFGIVLPDEGPDAVINIGLGLEFRRTMHAPFTSVLESPDHTFTEPTTATIAGLRVEFTPAPSDANDSVTIWFPELGVGVNNILWPTLFNVFAIRGEEYRDPRILLTGLDHLGSLGAEHLLGAHGVPLSGRDHIASEVAVYRDTIQFLWDQTVRGLNRGLTVDELTEFVQLPEALTQSALTQQFYGLAEHHVRQIHNGLRGWFDGHEALLFPTPPLERTAKLIEGFGGVEVVRAQVTEALAEGDHRWALELASWLVRSELDAHGRIDGGDPADRQLLANVLRTIAQQTTSSNARNWCLTRALELEGQLDLSRFRSHRFNRGDLDPAHNPGDFFTRSLRVMLDPQHAEGLEGHLRWEFADEGPGSDSPAPTMAQAGLHIRRGVAVRTDGAGADIVITTERAIWNQILLAKLSLDDALAAGSLTIDGDATLGRRLLGCFDLPSLAAD